MYFFDACIRYPVLTLIQAQLMHFDKTQISDSSPLTHALKRITLPAELNSHVIDSQNFTTLNIKAYQSLTRIAELSIDTSFTNY